MIAFFQIPELSFFERAAEQGALVLLVFVALWYVQKMLREHAQKELEWVQREATLKSEVASLQKELANAKRDVEAAAATELRAARDKQEQLSLRHLEAMTTLHQSATALREMVAATHAAVTSLRGDRLEAIERLLRGEKDA